jgi:hypothetical protein
MKITMYRFEEKELEVIQIIELQQGYYPVRTRVLNKNLTKL